MTGSSSRVAKTVRALPPGIWALGFGSLFMDMSSELVHSLLPVFMASVLGTGMVAIGLVEGVAEATAAVAKVFSGTLSDYLGRRKFLVVLGYGLAALTKPIFPLAADIGWVFGARFVDRLGKGIRGAPRDALIADITPPALRGAAYGLRQALDSVGAFLGPLLALIGMMLFAGDIKRVLWLAVVPAFIAVMLLVLAVREPEQPVRGKGVRLPIAWRVAWRLPLAFWLVLLVGAVFSLARFSEAFLVLRARSVGLALVYVPLVMIIMNVVYAAVSYPAGFAADRVSRRLLLISGLAALVLADIVLALAVAPWHVLVGALLWGLHMGLTQGLLAKLVADAAPTELRGTAFGIFNLVSGAALLLASVMAGILWDRYGVQATFLAGASLAALAAGGIFLYPRSPASQGKSPLKK